ncbi:MAG: hypothetical protein FWC02_03300 [Firmicutes bacterium]|nr:hypothetical protein [Bacillota bacterium]
MSIFNRLFRRKKIKNTQLCNSRFLGEVDGTIATYVFVWKDVKGDKNLYTMTDDGENVIVFESDESIEKTDGEHYFLITGTISEHREIEGQKQTVLLECKFELVDKFYNIKGNFFGTIGDDVELPNAKGTIRLACPNDFKATGEIIKKMPVSQYRMIVERGEQIFILPFDSKQKLTKKTTANYNIYAKVIGHTIENGKRATFIYPTRMECKNGPVYNGALFESFRASGRFGANF